MNWTQVRVHCTVKELDTVSAVMSMIDPGLMIEDYSDIEENLMTVYGELIDEKILNSDRERAAVSIYVPEEKDLSEVLSFLEERLFANGPSCLIEKVGIDEEDWANQWKQFYKPLRIGEHLVVLPPWEQTEIKEGDVVVVMDPGMAFGTGTHETTRLCMSMLEKYLVPGCKMLDVGTGSGILAVAGAKMGAERVCAYDIDPVAVRVANENFAANGVDDRVICGVSDLLLGVDRAEAPFTLVCANIVADILIRMAPDIASFMAVGGKLIASGIIEGRKEDVKAAMIKGGLAPIDSDEEKDWCALVFERR